MTVTGTRVPGTDIANAARPAPITTLAAGDGDVVEVLAGPRAARGRRGMWLAVLAVLAVLTGATVTLLLFLQSSAAGTGTVSH